MALTLYFSSSPMVDKSFSRTITAQMQDAGRDGGGAGPSTSGSLTSAAKLTSSSRYADVVGKVRF